MLTDGTSPGCLFSQEVECDRCLDRKVKWDGSASECFFSPEVELVSSDPPPPDRTREALRTNRSHASTTIESRERAMALKTGAEQTKRSALAITPENSGKRKRVPDETAIAKRPRRDQEEPDFTELPPTDVESRL